MCVLSTISIAFADPLSAGCYKGKVSGTNINGVNTAVSLSAPSAKGTVLVTEDSSWCSGQKANFRVRSRSSSNYYTGQYPDSCGACKNNEVQVKKVDNKTVEYRITVWEGGCALGTCFCNASRAKGNLRKARSNASCLK